MAVDRKDDGQIGAFHIGFEDRGVRSVAVHELLHQRYSGASSLCEIQILEEFTQSAVTVVPCQEAALSQIGIGYAEVGSGSTGDLHAIRHDVHSDRLFRIVSTMVYRIHDGFSDGFERIVVLSDGFCAILLFGYVFRDIVVLDDRESIADLSVDGAFDLMLPHPHACWVRLVDYLDPGVWKIILGVIVE